ncbi:osteoclast stimulatory transmembrane protein isoform X2 [Opisthocomus hoazin]|uniref:osteoclast stimulatory transmembrane protein isoform X2 n=1 Tax=Opisthocomus hoazin TaxID=30419 RepID=UPI003F5368D6
MPAALVSHPASPSTCIQDSLSAIRHWSMESFRARLGHLFATGMRARVYCEDFLFPKVCRTTADLWSVYSKPVPANGRELWTLFLQCSCITAVTGGLFYNWMFASLEYSWHFSVAMAIPFSLLLLLTLFLVHPARCVFSMIMPTLGTKQGRKLLLSTCSMIVVVNITPNIISNIKTILQVIKCICKNSAESLLNSTALLDTASWEFGDAIQETAHSINIYKPMNGHFQFSLLKNSSLIYQQLHLAGEKIGRDFLAAEVLVKDSVRVGNKLVAGFSMLYLCFESTWYLKNYLTSLCFDNFYITKKLERLAVDRKAAHLLVGSSKNFIRPTGLKFSREEVMLCLVQAMLLTVALMLMLVVVAMDHFAFSVADTAVRKAAQFSVVPVTLSIKYSDQPPEASQPLRAARHGAALLHPLHHCVPGNLRTPPVQKDRRHLLRELGGGASTLPLQEAVQKAQGGAKLCEKLRVLLEKQGMPETRGSGWTQVSAVGSHI